MKNKLMVLTISLLMASSSLIDASIKVSSTISLIKTLARETKLSDFKPLGYATVGTGLIVGAIEYCKQKTTTQKAPESRVDQFKQLSNSTMNSVQSTAQAYPYAAGVGIAFVVGTLGYLAYKKYFSKKS